MILGLSGYARSGKDTFADILVDKYDFKKVAFADKLRDCVYALNPYVVSEYSLNTLHLQEVIDHYGWNGYKNTPWGEDIRRVIQNMGTEVGRDILGPNIWVDATMNSLPPEENIVFTDCRFPNEADAVRNSDGALVRISRPGVKPVNAHTSETQLDDYDFDYRVVNDSTVKKLEKLADEIVLCETHVNTAQKLFQKKLRELRQERLERGCEETIP